MPSADEPRIGRNTGGRYFSQAHSLLLQFSFLCSSPSPCQKEKVNKKNKRVAAPQN